MAYHCVNCEHTESKRFPNGRCPRCGSYNIKSEKERLDYSNYRKRLSLGKFMLFVALLALLTLAIWERSQNSPLSLDEEYRLLQQQSRL